MKTAMPQMSPHRREASEQLSSNGQKAFESIEFDDDEQLVAEIRKHPIGLVFIVLGGAFIGLVILIVTAAVVINLNSLGFDFGSSSSAVHTGITAIGLLLVALVGVVTLITAYIYRANVVFLTNEKLAEVTYLSLFNRRVIQQGIGHIEDITVIQKGILGRIFDYGTLIVETAGDTQNLTFTLIPRPSQNSQLIMGYHEESIKKYGN